MQLWTWRQNSILWYCNFKECENYWDK